MFAIPIINTMYYYEQDAMVVVLHIKEGDSEASLASSLISGNAWIVTLTGILIISGLIVTMGALTKLFPQHKSVV